MTCGRWLAKARRRMNQYGAMAERHWRRWLPERCRAIQDPGSFFSMLGEETARQIADLAADLAGDDPPGEGYLEKVGRLNMARLQAEERVLAERVLLAPEPGAEEDPEETGDSPEASSDGEWIPLVARPGDPRWQEIVEEEQDLRG
jgi:hypothetical protein